MPIGSLEFSYNGESRSTPTLRNITIKAELSNGNYLTQPSAYTLVVFYGRPPNYGSDYPVTTYYLYTTSLQFTGDLNSVYSVAQVTTPDASIRGLLTASQPLPYSVTVGSPGSGVFTTLKPGQTSVPFDIAMKASTEQISEAVAGKLDQIRGK